MKNELFITVMDYIATVATNLSIERYLYFWITRIINDVLFLIYIQLLKTNQL